MSREAKIWRKLRPHGKAKQGSHIYLDSEKLQEALRNCKMADPSDLSQLRYRVSRTRTNRKSARILVEIKHLKDIPEHDLEE